MSETIDQEPEDTIPFEEIDDAIQTKEAVEILDDLLQQPSVSLLTTDYQESLVPVFLVDQRLSFLWANSQFQALFGDIDGYRGQHITLFYPESFDDDKKRDLYASTNSSDTGNTWRGQVQKKGIQGLDIISNLLILPVYGTTEPKQPVSFVVVLDDVSTEHNRLLRDTFSSLLEASRLKDNDTGNHIYRVNTYAERLASTLVDISRYPAVDRQFLADISFLAAMHDVGKIGTSDNILNKEGPLEDWEWDIMKEHTINGAYLMSTYPNPIAKDISLFHHEKWDGSGYPYGLSETMIPISASIVAIADVYDALRMARSYKKAYTHAKAIEIMIKGKSTHFDPDLFDNFLELDTEFEGIWNEMGDQE